MDQIKVNPILTEELSLMIPILSLLLASKPSPPWDVGAPRVVAR